MSKIDNNNEYYILNRREFIKKLWACVGIWWVIAWVFESTWNDVHISHSVKDTLIYEPKTSTTSFEQIRQTTYCNSRELLAYILDRGLIQTIKRNDYLQQLRADTSLQLKDDTRDLLEWLYDSPYSPKTNSVVRQIIYETLVQSNIDTINRNTNDELVKSIAMEITDLLHRYDTEDIQILKYMQIQIVDPWVWKSLNQETIDTIYGDIYRRETARNIMQQKTKAAKQKQQQSYSQTVDINELVYYSHGVKKYSHKEAYRLLTNENIKLRSTNLWYDETGESRWYGHTSLVNINSDTIDYIISCKKAIDSKYWSTGVWYITWATEYWDHGGTNQTSPTHPNWYKADVRGRWIAAIMIAINYWVDVINKPKDYSHDWTDIRIIYHDRHFDIRVIAKNL